MYLSKQHEFQVHIYRITIHSQSDLVQMARQLMDAYFLEYNSPWSQINSLQILGMWLMMPISWNYYG